MGSKGVFLIAASLLANESRIYSHLPSSLAACCDKMRWLELQLGRLPQTLDWHEVYGGVKNTLTDKGYDVERFDSYDVMFDGAIGLLMLKANLWQLKHLSRLPDTLKNLELIMSAEALRFALGYEDNFPDQLFPEGTSKSDIYLFFEKWRDQPAANELPGVMLYEGRKVTLTSVILGCKVIVNCENTSPFVDLAESILAALESLLATSIQDRLVAREPVLTINVRKSDFAQTPFSYELKDREGRPNLEVICSSFNSHKMSFDAQNQIKDNLRDLLIHVLARVCYVHDVEKTVVKLFKDEHALERAVNFTNSFVVLGNVLGHTPKTNIDSWVDSKAHDYSLKRNEEWDAAERRKRATAEENKPHSKLPRGEGKAPDGLFQMEGAKHTEMQVISVIREPLWNEAVWSGTGFFLSPDDSEPPILALLFKNPKAAKEIFFDWRKEFGRTDKEEKLRHNCSWHRQENASRI